ncbi:MAG: hypothetical protein ACRDGS_08405 [Chloroflexota bacterium]
MKKVTTVAQALIRGLGLLLIILGIIIWTGKSDGIIPLHRFLGIVIVLALWTLAYVASRSGVSAGLIALAVAWGLVAPILGLSQEHVLTGNGHWIIQILHLLIGLGVIALGEMLALRIKGIARSRPANSLGSPSPAPA